MFGRLPECPAAPSRSTAWRLVLVSALSLATACTNGDGDAAEASVSSLAPLVTPVPAATSAATSTTSTTSTTIPPETTTSTTSTTSPPETTTTFPFVNQGAWVIVANAADVPGAATKFTEALAEYGFAMLDPTNGAGPEERIGVTRIYALPEAQAVAASVARVMGGIAVERMPTPAPIVGATDGLGEAGVLVMLGKDLAGEPLPGPPTN